MNFSMVGLNKQQAPIKADENITAKFPDFSVSSEALFKRGKVGLFSIKALNFRIKRLSIHFNVRRSRFYRESSGRNPDAPIQIRAAIDICATDRTRGFDFQPLCEAAFMQGMPSAVAIAVH